MSWHGVTFKNTFFCSIIVDLTFGIVNRDKHSVDKSPLLFSNPHLLMPFVDYTDSKGKVLDVDSIPCPRILATYIPHQCLPSTIWDRSNSCRIIYICRNLLDVFTSMMHFMEQNDFTTEPSFGPYCLGTLPYGPFWDHILGYWNASLENPQKVLFLKYEDLKRDINSSVKKIAEFLGYPFSGDEEEAGLVEEIANLCSFENLKSLECNKEGETKFYFPVKHSSFFRKAEIGDWVNFLPPSMAERLQNVIQGKLGESGLMLETNGKSR